MKRILFFATPADISPVLQHFEANAPLKFVEMGTLTTPNRAIYLESALIPNPGIATHETGSLSRGYMVSYQGTKNHMDSSVTRKGERRWNLFNSDNEETVILSLAGFWKTGTLLPGIMDTLHQTPAAQQLMKWFLAALKQEGFTKIDLWWLGREALEMLKAGKRLTKTAEQSPPEFDLKLPASIQQASL
ncbi:hypothetical protein QH494_14060 [Sphingomonas sp. AR_OL41]|uniref:hypothetical protein n=1 Tax=Sphingomonas sp. AR_OL41 TaxID=3042729 RepID=UPI00247FE6C6|nr:hypothetical protein [Sphingomonas sp. AR_OL41]MDH7973310.1 hypothetical protein [Sphingomonas sp. AR_OL41]